MPSRIVVLSAPEWTMRLFSRFWPASEEEQQSQTRYIHDQAIDDVDTALDLVHLEQARVLRNFSDYLDTARMGETLGSSRDSTREVNARIDEFLGELSRQHPGVSGERHNVMLNRQKLIDWLEEQFSILPDVLQQLPEDPVLETFRMSVVEGTDAAFLIFLDALEDEDPEAWEFVVELMGDRRVMMQEVRSRYLPTEQEDDPERSRLIVEATNAVENIFFLLAQLMREFRTDDALMRSSQSER
jgi:phosphate:Na+ symporter